MSFLNAEWRKLILINYEVDSSVLLPYLPPKTELDLFEGKAYVSVVGFLFVNTKMVGIKIPFHINFEEVNLRFYVKHKAKDGWRRGVVFIKEIVPKFAISTVANLIYKEHYETCKMRHKWIINDEVIDISYSWKKKGLWNSISVKANNIPTEIQPNSDLEFITEHYWGYTKINETKSFEYEVKHPIWKIYPIIEHKIDVDFGVVYGKDFDFLKRQEPASIMLAEGSEISVEKAVRI